MDEFDVPGELDASRMHTSSISELVSGLLGQDLRKKLSTNQAAAASWYAANGDIERQHTTGVFLKKNPKSKDPILCVYVDSHSRMTDFYVQRELYLARLANVGCKVSGIEFLLTHRPADKVHESRQQEQDTASEEVLPALTANETARVRELCSCLDDKLRPIVEQAVELSMRRQKLQHTDKANTSS